MIPVIMNAVGNALGPALGFIRNIQLRDALLVGLAIYVVLMHTLCKPEPPEPIYIAPKVINETTYVSETIGVDQATLNKILEDSTTNYRELRGLLRDMDARLVGVSSIVASAASQQQTDTVLVECEDNVSSSEPVRAELSVSFEEVELPVGEAVAQVDDNELILWTRSYDMEIRNNLFLLEQRDGFVTLASELTLESNSISYNLPVESRTFTLATREPVQDHGSNRFMANYHAFDIGIEGTLSLSPDFFIGPGYSFLAFGNKELIMFRFLRAGITVPFTGNSAGFTFTPIMYNLGHAIGPIRGTYIGPSINYLLNNEFNIGLQLSVPL